MVAGMAEAGQRHDEPFARRRTEGRSYQDTLAEIGPKGNHPLQMETMAFDGQDAT
jgi:hypothetical protein